MSILRAAFLHIGPRLGQIEYNQRFIEEAIDLAAGHGARWIVTPELCVSGYYFADQIGTDWIQPQPDRWMNRLLEVTQDRGLTLFLSYPERDRETGRLFNSVFALCPDGKIAGRHRKIRVHGGAEEWSAKGTDLLTTSCDGIKVGFLICADAYHPEIARTLKSEGADILISPTAWPPEPCGPEDCWERRTAETGLPIWVCNRTGQERHLDYRRAESVIAGNGKRLLQRAVDRSAILLFDWDMKTTSPVSSEFEVTYLGK